MGGGLSINYAVPVSDPKPGQTAVYRFPKFKDSPLKSAPRQDLTTIKAILLNSAKVYKNGDCLGTIIRKENQKTTIKFTTYEQTINMGIDIGSGIIHEGLVSHDLQNKLSFVGIFSRNRPEWTIVDIGCALYKIVTIPIYDTLGDENITYVLKHTGLTTCFVNDKSVQSLIKTHDFVNLKTLVSFDTISPENTQKLLSRGVKIIDYNELLKIGQANRVDYNDPKYKIDPEDCLTFSYTSGTTGPPKGAMLAHRNFCSFCAGISSNKDLQFSKNDTILSYLPLPHILERQLLYGMLYVGGRVIYYSGDVQKIKDDLAVAKPTVFVSVPRLFNRFHDIIKAKFNELQGWTKTALDHALSVKLNNVKSNGGITHRVYDRIFFNKTKEALGGNVRLMISGSAPLLPEVHSFLKVVMCAPLLQAYGSTQSTGGCVVTDAHDPQTSHIGGTVYKLVDIPEMNYTSKDLDENKQPYPRGEICLRGPCVFLGYYKDQQKTKETINGEGWLQTGDVGAILPKTKALKIIDRKKNIFKLQQGEYVAPQKVQALYLKSHNISEAFLTGDSTQTFAVAVVTPNKKHIEQLAKEANIQGSYQDLCKNNAIRIEILTELTEYGKKGGLQSFQQAKNLYLQPQNFLAKGIVTNTMKIQRHEGRKVYSDIIKEMYVEGMLPSKKEKK